MDMLKIPRQYIVGKEKDYPGIIKQLDEIEKRSLPNCFLCGSDDTAVVSVGVIGRTILLAGASTKFHLRPNGKPGEFYCNTCQKYFDVI